MRTHLRLLVGLVALLFVSTFAKAQWTEIPSLPVTLRWPMTVEFGGKIYAFGGLASTGSKDVYTYTPGAAEWVKLNATMPKGKWSGFAGVINGKIYITGGFIVSGTSTTVNGETYEFDPVAETFTLKKAMTTSTKVAYLSGAVFGDKLWIMGGYNNGDKTAIHVYDPATDTWMESETEVPYLGRLAASTVHDGKIYRLGGLTTAAYVPDAWRGTPNPADGTILWEQIADLPAALCRASAGVSNGKVVFTGGFPLLPDGYSNTYVYNETSNEWEISYPLPSATTDAGPLVAINNELHYVGGIENKMYKYAYTTAQKPAAVVNATPIFHNLEAGKAVIAGFTVQNLGMAPLNVNFTIPAAATWLSSTKMSAVIDPMTKEEFSLSLFAGTLNPGLYKADIVITTDDEAHASTTLPVKLYVLPAGIEAQPTRVVVEEGTGDWCQYCPDGHRVLNELHDAFAEDVIILSYHGGSSTEPMMIADGQNILYLLSLGGYPNASIQRWHFEGEPGQMTNRGSWMDYVQQVLDEQPKAAADITVVSQSFDPATKIFKATVEIELNQAVLDREGALRLTTVVTENGLNHWQQDVSTRYQDYEHNEVARNVYPDPFGATLTAPEGSIVEGVIAPGTKITKQIEFNVNSDITDTDWHLQNPANSFVTYIVHGVDGAALTPILHAAQLPLTTQLSVQTGTVASTVSVSNYPNPVSKSARFSYSVSEPSIVNIAVYDVMGREVANIVSNEHHAVGTYETDFNASKLSNGTYTYVLSAGTQKVTGTMIVQK